MKRCKYMNRYFEQLARELEKEEVLDRAYLNEVLGVQDGILHRRQDFDHGADE